MQTTENFRTRYTARVAFTRGQQKGEKWKDFEQGHVAESYPVHQCERIALIFVSETVHWERQSPPKLRWNMPAIKSKSLRLRAKNEWKWLLGDRVCLLSPYAKLDILSNCNIDCFFSVSSEGVLRNKRQNHRYCAPVICCSGYWVGVLCSAR